MSKIRTFIAIEIPDSIHQKIAKVQDELKSKQEKARISWTKPGNIHLTLRFLGDVEESRINSVVEAIEKAVQPFSSFDFLVRNFGAFPNFRRPRVLWIGIENPPSELTQMAQNIEDELSTIGFTSEKRKFSAHLTIGRVKSSLSQSFVQLLQARDFEGGQVRVKEVVVMKSDLRPTGAVYTPLKKIKLKGS
ncbi:MAG: RNA 2',3'-cyclic phosphodiesterase [bacterium]